MTFQKKKILVIHSQQPSNQYAGGAAGIGDSEQFWMRKLAQEVFDLLAATGHDVRLGPKGTASSTYQTNVTWANKAENADADLLISLHSNATGKSEAQAKGTVGLGAYHHPNSPKGAAFTKSALPFLKPVSAKGKVYIDTLTVAEVASTKPPAVLFENEYHDWQGSPTEGGANWIRDDATRTRLAMAYRDWIVSMWGSRSPATTTTTTTAATTTTTTTPKPTTTTTTTAPPVPKFPLAKGYYFGPKEGPKESVSGYYDTQKDGTKGHDGLALAQRQLRALGYLQGPPDGLYGPDTDRAARLAQKAANGAGAKLAVDGCIGEGTWPWLWKLSAPTTTTTTTARPTVAEFQMASYNVQARRWGGGPYVEDAKFIAKSLPAPVLATCETEKAALDAILGRNELELYAHNFLGIFWDPRVFKPGERVTLNVNTSYHGMVGTELTHRATGAKFFAGSFHNRPNDSYSKSWTDAQVLAAKLAIVQKLCDKLKGYEDVLVGGDFSTKHARKVMEKNGYRLLTPWEDTGDAPGDNYWDQIYAKGKLVGKNGVIVKSPASDHHGLLVDVSAHTR